MLPALIAPPITLVKKTPSGIPVLKVSLSLGSTSWCPGRWICAVSPPTRVSSLCLECAAREAVEVSLRRWGWGLRGGNCSKTIGFLRGPSSLPSRILQCSSERRGGSGNTNYLLFTWTTTKHQVQNQFWPRVPVGISDHPDKTPSPHPHTMTLASPPALLICFQLWHLFDRTGDRTDFENIRGFLSFVLLL